ncbi:dienelactone hydrolase [Photobacterium lipolyticum]|uniref:Dienelactone hydrolase n=1 Tax=Photobacterium lipolyticum TaxID=266810 RepID=A0A2T3N3R1_9GAMM|nr:dienelactone hydrolase [Photobacterium lipolyticum]
MKMMLATLLFTTGSALALQGESVRYQVNGQNYEGYYISPAKDAPLILMVHDWDGLTDYEVKRAEMLVEEGYAVFAVDLFGAGIRPTKVEDRRQHTGELYKDRQKMRDLLNGGLKAAEAKGAKTEDVVAMGYCFGGAAVLELARSGADIKGFVTFHGGLKTPPDQDYAKTKGSVLIMHGAADQAISMEDFAALSKALEASQVSHEMIVYSGAPHAFTVFDSPNYRQEADRKSWHRFLTYLNEVK